MTSSLHNTGTYIHVCTYLHTQIDIEENVKEKKSKIKKGIEGPGGFQWPQLAKKKRQQDTPVGNLV